ncbi:LamB/YcsF family protein [Oceanobacillus timonensis]|uniref:LamB/YcsF family protein n=1 Tax=Oceanobacillus timonensis TaxID=1926285 RepID=UPI0009BBA6BA|nr:5-oxoprolinase subunit PxpA [Oceanobacillus timonensis]
MLTIDINCDMGESFGAYKMGADEEILPFITSANIACGFHAGDPSTMRNTVQLAMEHGVKLGAHPGLQDLIGFGRRNMDISYKEAYDLVQYQVGALQGIVKSEGGKLQHVKAHGALYNMAATNENLAEGIAQAVYDLDSNLILYGLAGSKLLEAGEKVGLQTASEVFADRTYQETGMLTSRREANALIEDVDTASAQVIRMVTENQVETAQGKDIMIQADTICIHGDGANALAFAKQVKEKVKEAGITVQAFQK